MTESTDTTLLGGGEGGGGEGEGSGANGAGDGGGEPRWQDSLPDDLKDTPSFATFKTVEDSHRAHLALVKKMGAPAENFIQKPTGDDDTAGWNNFFKSAGRPDAADEYKIDLGDKTDEADEDYLKAIRDGAHAVGLSQKQLSGVVNSMLAADTSQMERAEATVKTNREKATAELKTEWGTETDKNLALAQRATRHFFGEDTLALIEATHMGDLPDFVKGFAKIGGMIAEDTVAGGAGGGTFGGTSPEKAREGYKAIIHDPEKAKILRDKTHPDYAATRAEYDKLLADMEALPENA